MYRLNFLACAIGKLYEEFLPPFTFFALQTNPNSHVEIVVVNKKLFLETYQSIFTEIEKICGRNFQIREFSRPLNHHIPNTYRFFEVPTIRAEYTYIADIDIMFLEDIVKQYTSKWPSSGYPYNNMVRKNSMRLTGLHFVQTETYFTNLLLKEQDTLYKSKKENDEVILFKLCNNIFGSPDFNFFWRPVLGIHFSPNRGIGKSMDLVTSKYYADIFNSLLEKYPSLKNKSQFLKLQEQLKLSFIIK